jgi:hypothetical protein
MKKLQLVTLISLLAVAQAYAQSGTIGQVSFEYQCQQDPQLMGVGTKLTVAYGETASDGFIATLIRSVVTMPPQSSTQTFEDLTREESLSGTIYEGTDFKLTISPDAIIDPRIGRVFAAELITSDTGSKGQKLFCKQGDATGMPAVTGSN